MDHPLYQALPKRLLPIFTDTVAHYMVGIGFIQFLHKIQLNCSNLNETISITRVITAFFMTFSYDNWSDFPLKTTGTLYFRVTLGAALVTIKYWLKVYKSKPNVFMNSLNEIDHLNQSGILCDVDRYALKNRGSQLVKASCVFWPFIHWISR